MAGSEPRKGCCGGGGDAMDRAVRDRKMNDFIMNEDRIDLEMKVWDM